MYTVQTENISMIFWSPTTDLSAIKQSVLVNEQQNGQGQPDLPAVGRFER
jgi:hypothetical protein